MRAVEFVGELILSHEQHGQHLLIEALVVGELADVLDVSMRRQMGLVDDREIALLLPVRFLRISPDVVNQIQQPFAGFGEEGSCRCRRPHKHEQATFFLL
jgi:hypothetical protein